MRAIISADLHLRSDKPRCRKDEDWEAFQEHCLSELVRIANEQNAELIIVGDMWDTPTQPSRIVSMFLTKMMQVRRGIRILAGNHDLPYHSWANIANSAMGIIDSIIKGSNGKIGIRYIDDIGEWSHFGEEPKNKGSSIVFTHRLTFPNTTEIPPNVNAVTAAELLKEYPKAKWIFTGDMHKSFHYSKNGKHVINPGCLNRQVADFKDYKCSVYFVNTDTEEVQQIEIRDDEELVTDEYIKDEKEREDRIGSFIEAVNEKKGSVSLSFTDNVEDAINSSKKELGKGAIKVIRELMEDES